MLPANVVEPFAMVSDLAPRPTTPDPDRVAMVVPALPWEMSKRPLAVTPDEVAMLPAPERARPALVSIVVAPV